MAPADLLAGASCFDDRERLRDRTVLLATERQLNTAVALFELDGRTRRLVLCTPDLTDPQLEAVAAAVGADAIVTDGRARLESNRALLRCGMRTSPRPCAAARPAVAKTEWILLTSGTTQAPRPVLHTLESLACSLPGYAGPTGNVWSTFYDIRRYGGLQIYLRAVLGGSPLVLSHPGESASLFLARAAAEGVTHMSGTPSHWRRMLMAGSAGAFNPRYIRLSGEVADQPLLNSLRAAFPTAVIAHAFASTEAGVGFAVDDGKAGFPAAFLNGPDGGAPEGVDLKVENGTVHIRSRGNAAGYLGPASAALAARDGFVDTGDLVERVADRYYFRGRRGGVINVGGLKIYPEEVESVLNADSRVRMSRVSGRPNPVTGAVVVAEVVLAESAYAAAGPRGADAVRDGLMRVCRQSLPAHKVPAILRVVPALPLTAAGKLARGNA